MKDTAMIDLAATEYDPAVTGLLADYPNLPKTGSTVGSCLEYLLAQCTLNNPGTLLPTVLLELLSVTKATLLADLRTRKATTLSPQCERLIANALAVLGKYANSYGWEFYKKLYGLRALFSLSSVDKAYDALQKRVYGAEGPDPLLGDWEHVFDRIVHTGTRPGSFLANALIATQADKYLCDAPLRTASPDVDPDLPVDDLLRAARHTLSAVMQCKVEKQHAAFCWRQIKLAQWELDDHLTLKDNAMWRAFDAGVRAIEQEARELHQKDALEQTFKHPNWLRELTGGATEFYAQQAAFKAVGFVSLHYGLPWSAVCHHLLNAPADPADDDVRHVTQMLENIYVDMYENDEGIDEWCGIIRPTAPALGSVVTDMGSACKVVQR
jgi:hypothetical protein